MDCVSQTSDLPSGWHLTKSQPVEVADGGERFIAPGQAWKVGEVGTHFWICNLVILFHSFVRAEGTN